VRRKPKAGKRDQPSKQGELPKQPEESLTSLRTEELLRKLKTQGFRWTAISVATTLLLGIVDQFTSRIIPSIAGRIEALVDPPKFFVRFNPSADIAGGLTISAMSATAVTPVKFNPVGQGIAALAGPGAYELRLRRERNGVKQELVDAKTIEKTDQTWVVDTGERNWANAAALLPGTSSVPTTGTGPSRLNSTRWTTTEQDFAVLATVQDAVLRSMLANALAEVGVFEDGTERERQRVLSYWTGIMNVTSNLPWNGAFLGWVVKQAGAQPPSGAARVLSWRNWDDEVARADLSPGMVAIFQPTSSVSTGLGGIVLRAQPNCIEVILGNVADRVVISCVRADTLVTVRRPGPARPKPNEPMPKGE
jgi:uncharacterized protein (TIGR02594 family)